MTDFLLADPAASGPVLVLAHGAGAAMDSPFMSRFADLMAERGVATARFEFPYMAARRTGGKKRPPPKAESLTNDYLRAVAEIEAAHPGRRVFIGGKSMGGRVASHVADELYRASRIAGLVCLGYPFHPPNTPGTMRTAHFFGLRCPMLIVQGERDPFGSRAEIDPLPLSKAIEIAWIGDGDHDLGPRGASGFTRKGNLAVAADTVAAFVSRLAAAA